MLKGVFSDNEQHNLSPPSVVHRKKKLYKLLKRKLGYSSWHIPDSMQLILDLRLLEASFDEVVDSVGFWVLNKFFKAFRVVKDKHVIM